MNESERAVMESARFAAMESYFEARPQIAITRKLECIFEAGFDAAYAEVRRLREEVAEWKSAAGVAGLTVDKLREENERLRKDSAVSAAIERAAKDLPDGDMLEITVEKGSAMVVLYWGQGGFETMDVDDENRLAAEINAAIDAARGAK